MKKICRYLKLRKLKSGVVKECLEALEGNDFIVIYQDGTTEPFVSKEDLYTLLSRDHIKPIRYIFDMTDRIVIDRDVIINTNEVK